MRIIQTNKYKMKQKSPDHNIKVKIIFLAFKIFLYSEAGAGMEASSEGGTTAGVS